jgi:phosphotriesterase-related protein
VSQVHTVRGPVDAAALGQTLMHEHIFVMSTEIVQNFPEAWGDEEQRIEQAVTRLLALEAHGISSILDLTVLGLGRYIPRIAKIAERVNINIMVATGLYVMESVPFYFYHRGPGTALGGPEIMVEMFVRDIEEGIGETGVHAAALKCAIDAAGMTRDVERVTRAVARAHLATGVPISTHTNGSQGTLQQRVLADEGVDLGRVVIGHSNDTDDISYLEELIDNGSYLGMDHFGIDAVSFEDRVSLVATMCARGYAERMVLSHDAVCFTDIYDMESVAQWPNWNYNHISEDVLPALKQRGVTDAQIETMLVVNPREILQS